MLSEGIMPSGLTGQEALNALWQGSAESVRWTLESETLTFIIPAEDALQLSCASDPTCIV